MDIAKLYLPMWGGAEFSPSLSEGMSVPKAVHPALVEKVRVPWCYVSFMRREGERSLSPDVKGLGVRRSGTFQWEGMRPTIMPSERGSRTMCLNALVCCLVPGKFSGPMCNTLFYGFANQLLITFISFLTPHQILG
jgi:hypothetical protein